MLFRSFQGVHLYRAPSQRECLPTGVQECPSNFSTRLPRVSHTSVLQERFGLFKKSLLRICQQIFTELISVANLRKVHPKKVVRNPQYIGNLGLHFAIFHPISPSPVLSHIAEEPCEIGKIITVDKGLGARVA